jgi:two-component system sensor histidine kinase KdpD
LATIIVMNMLTKVWRWGWPLLLLFAVTIGAWALRETLTIANATMIYILVVLVLAIRRGTRIAMAGSFVSFLCINFFLVRPYYTFGVADPREVLDLIVFFIVSAVVGQLAARARQEAYEQEILYRLTRSFNQLLTRDGVHAALVDAFKTDFGAQQAWVLPYESRDVPPGARVHYLLLQPDQTVYGTLCAAFDTPPTPEEVRLFNTCATQAAMALNRIELTERARRSQQYEEADRLKTALLRAVSHDLRTPITIIKSSASNLRTLGERLPEAERAELSHTIEQEADQLDRLVGNLLDLSRLQAGELMLSLAPNSLEEVAGDVAAQVFQRQKEERIRLEFAEDMPLVSFDYGLILQALTNVVENSLRYEPPGSRIVLQGEKAVDEVHLRVVNHGEPISPRERELIMQPFYTGRNGQIGLGLPIAKGIVEAHRGRLWVEDTPGTGATFVIALPIREGGTHAAAPLWYSALPTALNLIPDPIRTQRECGGRSLTIHTCIDRMYVR